GVTHYPWGWNYRYGSFRIIFLPYFFSVLIISLRHYWRQYECETKENAKKRIRLFMLAFAISYFGVLDFLPDFGIPYYPLGFQFVSAFWAMATWVVWHYHLVDLTPDFAAEEILETMQGAVIVADMQGFIRFSNRAAQDLLGISPKLLVGQP